MFVLMLLLGGGAPTGMRRRGVRRVLPGTCPANLRIIAAPVPAGIPTFRPGAKKRAACPLLPGALLEAGCEDADLPAHCLAGCPHGADCRLLPLLSAQL